VTATFQVLYVFVAIEIGSRRLLHVNVTDHPTAEWTLQQFRAFLDGECDHRYLIHDRDTVFSAEVAKGVNGFGLKVLKLLFEVQWRTHIASASSAPFAASVWII
jgi:hypothetical protein